MRLQTIVPLAASALLVTACATTTDQYGPYERQSDDRRAEDLTSRFEAPTPQMETSPRAIDWYATCQGESTWRNWGAAPYAGTDEIAFERLPEALRQLGIPEELHEEFLMMVSENPDGERTMRITADHRLVAMMSGEADRPVMCNPTVADIPVNTSGTIVQAALARVWEIEYQGEVFTLVLPEICRNWSWLVEPARVVITTAPEPREDCGAIAYHVPLNAEVRHFLWSREEEIPYSICEGLVQVNRLTSPPSPCDDCVPGRLSQYLRANYDVGEIVERNRYTSRYEGMHMLLVPLSRMEEHTTVCVDPAGHERLTSATVEPEGYYGGRRVGVDEDDWYVYDEAQLLEGTNLDGEPVRFRIRAIAVIPDGAFQVVR